MKNTWDQNCYYKNIKINLIENSGNTSVKASTNISDNDVNFNHIIEHALSCTLEESGEGVLSVSGLRFGMIHEVLKVAQMRLH